MRKTSFTAEGRLLQKRLQEMARESGLSGVALARKLGAFQNQIWRTLKGDRRLDLIEFVWWCDACGKDPDEEFSALVGAFRLLNRSKTGVAITPGPPKRSRRK
ncbi:MAG: hypothetical protein K8T20_15130 [Planctomycetes bacterium]|nr:hypothetical protein [Planctomycetota bacterium]